MILRSIRWRLVASYVLLTLLAVGSMGVLAIYLVGRYAYQQELDYLTSNAEAIARQAQPWMGSRAQQARVRELAHTSAFLINAQVRILDVHREVIADSGPRREADEVVWVVPMPLDLGVASGSLGVRFGVLPGIRTSMTAGQRRSLFGELPSDGEMTIVRRVEGPWGNRLVFATRQEWELTTTAPLAPQAGRDSSPSEEGMRRSGLVIVAPIGDDDPVGYVELSRSPDYRGEALSTTRRAVLLASGAAALLSAGVGLLVSRGLTAPVRNLTAAASRMGGGDLSARAQVKGQDEIAELARQFNQMAEGLETSFAELAAERDALRRFTADASHELRTPITALKTFNEILQGDAAGDPLVRHEFLAESENQLNRLEWITQNLLDLSRLEAGLVKMDMGDCNALELVQAVAAGFKALAEERGITLLTEGTRSLASGPQIHCDRARIELALANLLDNALKFTPAGGTVEVGIESAGEVVRLWVRDDGPGIQPEDLPHIFERFYRGRDSVAEGSGLGLAIVRSVVQAHGGRAFVESQPGNGSRFVIELPAASSREP